MFKRCDIPEQELADFVDGKLPDERLRQVAEHLVACATCRQRVDGLNRLIGLMRSDDSVELPAWVLERAARAFRHQQPEPRPNLVEKIVAALVFDSRGMFQPAGVRQAARVTRRLLYRTPDADVDLHIEPGERAGESNMLGQFLPNTLDETPIAAEVQLLRGNRKILSKRLDTFGEFTFARLAPGKYTIRIAMPSRELQLDDIDVT